MVGTKMLIFGSCYSYFSVVKSIMIAHGLFSALAVASQKGNVCVSFQFDEDQRVLLLDYVLKLQFPQIVLIVGSSGTGKTIMALECMRAKIGKLNLESEGTKAQKKIGSNYKVIAIIWIFTTHPINWKKSSTYDSSGSGK